MDAAGVALPFLSASKVRKLKTGVVGIRTERAKRQESRLHLHNHLNSSLHSKGQPGIIPASIGSLYIIVDMGLEWRRDDSSTLLGDPCRII